MMWLWCQTRGRPARSSVVCGRATTVTPVDVACLSVSSSVPGSPSRNTSPARRPTTVARSSVVVADKS